MRYSDEVRGYRLLLFLSWFGRLTGTAPGRDLRAVQLDRRPRIVTQFPGELEHAPPEWILHRCVLCCFFLCGQIAEMGLVTEFELGLELDSAEVRGILIYEGQDWGHVVFDFRT